MRNRLSLKQFLFHSSTLIIFVVTCMGCLALLYHVSQRYTVKQVRIEGNVSTVPLRGLETLEGEYMFLIEKKELAHTLINQNPHLKGLSITKEYPHTLVFEMEFYQPAAVLDVQEGFYVISADGRILEKTREKPTGIPSLTIYQSTHYLSYQAGEILDTSELRYTLAILADVTKYGYDIDTIDVQAFHMIALQGEGVIFLVSAEQPLDDTMHDLRSILKQLAIQGKTFRVLNLRFDKPIIQF